MKIIPITHRSQLDLAKKDWEEIEKYIKEKDKVYNLITNNNPIPKDNFYVFILLSGGLSKTISRIIKKSNSIIISYWNNNSLATALSLKKEFNFLHYHIGEINNYKQIASYINSIIKLQYIVENLLNTTIATINIFSTKSNLEKNYKVYHKKIKNLANLFGIYYNFNIVELDKKVLFEKRKIDEEIKVIIKNFIKKIKNYKMYNYIIEQSYNIFKSLYYNMVNDNIEFISINCEKFIDHFKFTPFLLFNYLGLVGLGGSCFSRLGLILSLLLSKYYYGKIGLDADIINIYNNIVSIATCNTNGTLLKDVELDLHFESKYPVGVKGKLDVNSKYGYLFKIWKNKMDLVRVKILGNKYKFNTCTFKLDLELLDNFNPIDNHYVFIPKIEGDYSLEIFKDLYNSYV